MKNTRLGPLLFLLLLAVATRSGSATPIPLDPITPVDAVVGVRKTPTEAIDWSGMKIVDSYGVDEAITKLENQIDKLPIEEGQMHQKLKIDISGSATPITTVQAVVGVTKALTEAIDWFEKKIIDSHGIDEAITKLENQIDNFPIELGQMHQEVLEGLYRSRFRVVRTRSYLEKFAKHLKSQCEGLIAMYNRKGDSSRLVNSSVKRFVKLASNVNDLLKKASKAYEETHDELSKTKATLKSFNSRLDMNQQNVSFSHNEKINGMRNTCFYVTIFTLGIGGFICYPVINGRISVLRDLLDELQKQIVPVQDTIENLDNQNDEISKYIMKEIHLVDEWEFKLVQSLSDHIEMTPEEIEFELPLIRSNLAHLRDACIKYLNHKLPEVLQALIS